MATDLDRAREIGDWLFVFEAARETHMFQGAADDRVLMFVKQRTGERIFIEDETHLRGLQPMYHKIRGSDGDMRVTEWTCKRSGNRVCLRGLQVNSVKLYADGTNLIY